MLTRNSSMTIFLYALILSCSSLSGRNDDVRPRPIEHDVALPESTSPDNSIIRLKKSNLRFVMDEMVHPRHSKAIRKELADEQHPDAIVLSCSDSRVPPEVVFDEGLGELFVVRTAGHVVDEMAAASIEYGIDHLKANLIVVLGHESCGAIRATLSLAPGASAGSPNLDLLASAIRENLNQSKITKSNDPLFVDAVHANIRGTIKSLLSRSKIVRESVAKGEVKVVPAIYHLVDGQVEFLKTDTPPDKKKQ